MATREAELLQDNDTEAVDSELLVSASVALTAQERASIDIQIETARRYPRSVKKCIEELVVLCTLDQETAESMTYALKRTDEKGQAVFITGPSVRFAEMVAHAFGNCRAGGRVVAIDDTFITGQGVCHDLEKNVAVAMETRRRITNKKGRRYSEDMIVTTGNAAAAIAFRNAVFKVFPFALVKKAHDAAKAMAAGLGVPIEQRRARAIGWFAKWGKTEADVLRVIRVAKIEDITTEHLETLNALRVSVQEGSATIQNIFDEDGNGKSEDTEKLNEQLKKEPQTDSPAKIRAQHALYMKKLNEASPNCDDVTRRAWQEEHVGKKSTKDWAGADYTKAIQLLEAGIVP